MLYDVLQYLNVLNHPEGKLISAVYSVKDAAIVNGSIDLPLLDGQPYIIEGSVFNDGLHYYPSDILDDEVFSGRVIALRIPQQLMNIVSEIEEYAEKNPVSGFTSESFGGYSYTRASGNNGRTLDAIHVFADRLKGWKML